MAMKSVSILGHMRLVIPALYWILFSITSTPKSLTSLSNAQIVAELGWTRKAIKAVLGVTPTTMRPPKGDIGLSSSTYLAIHTGLTDVTQMIGFAPSRWLWAWSPSSGLLRLMVASLIPTVQTF